MKTLKAVAPLFVIWFGISALIAIAGAVPAPLAVQPVQNDHVLIGELIAVAQDGSDLILSVDVGAHVAPVAAGSKQCAKAAHEMAKALPQLVRVNFFVSDDASPIRCYILEGLRRNGGTK